MNKIVIIGGGSSGLACAVSLAKKLDAAMIEAQICILERKERLGKKLLATGNGRCNLSNKDLSIHHYESHHVERIKEIIHCFDCQAFFESLGLWTKYMGDLLYPQSEQALSVYEMFEKQLSHYHIQIECNQHVHRIEKKNHFKIYTEHSCFEADYVVLATGGDVASQLGSDGSGFTLLKQFGHTIYPTSPSLVQLVCKKMDRSLKGTRIHGTFTMYVDHQPMHTQKGELLFTEYGLSGISILQLSRFYQRYKGRKVEISIDALDQYDEATLANKLKIRWQNDTLRTLCGIVHQKYANYLEKQCLKEYSYKELNGVIKILKDCRFEVIDTRTKKDAQVCLGGASLLEFDLKTFESCKVKHLYAGGELLDVAGDCGGYNLHFAFASGDRIATAIFQELNWRI